MAGGIGVIKRILPPFPRRIYGIFIGTNTLKEFCSVIVDLLLMRSANDEKVIQRYEKEFARHAHSKYAVSFGAGRMALYAILEALNVGANDEVIVSGFTCVVVPNAILYRGASPVYTDIELRTFNQLPTDIEQKITSRTRAIIAQHTFGVACNMSEIMAIANKYNIPVIEDCGHAQGAFYNGVAVATIGIAGFFTTDHSKISSTHLGGMLTTNSPEFAAQVKAIQGRTGFLNFNSNIRLLVSFVFEFILYSPIVFWLGRPLLSLLNKLGILFYWRDEMLTERPTNYPYPARLGSQQASIGLSQLRNIGENLSHRKKIVRILDEELKCIGLNEGEIASSSWLRYSFLVQDRKQFEKKFQKQFSLGVWFTSVVHGRRELLDKVGYKSGSCPNAELAAKHIVNFPTHKRIPIKFMKQLVKKNGMWIRKQQLKLLYPEFK